MMVVNAAQDSGTWRETWSQGMSEHHQEQEARRLEAEKNVVCIQCWRCFRSERDKACHFKCIAERRKSVSEQADAFLCESCGRWFRSRGVWQ